MLCTCLLAMLMLLGFAIEPALAECSTTMSSAMQTGYNYREFGTWGSRKPVLQSEATLTCGNWSFDLWTSAGLGGGGTFGRRGGADEADLSVLYNDSFDSPLGTFTYEVGVSYYALGFGKNGLLSVADDVANAYVELGRPLHLGAATLTPFIRPAVYHPVSGKSHDDWVVRSGVKFTVPLNRRLSAEGDISVASILNQHKTVFRPTAMLVAKLDDGWSVSAGSKYTNFTGPVWYLGISKKF